MATRLSCAALASAYLLLAGCGGRLPDQSPAAAQTVRTTQAAPDDVNFDPTEPLEAGNVLVRLFANGTARSTSGRLQFLSFSIQATRDPLTGLTLGTLFMTDSTQNISFFGAILGGTLTHASETGGAGGGTGTFTGLLARNVTFSLTVTDRASRRQRDTITFNVPGQFSFNGQVFRKDIAIVRAARPMRPFEISPPGTRFHSAIGLHVLEPDVNTPFGPQLPIPRPVIELTRPEPIIDFQRNRPGGFILPPGSEDNVPGANPDVEPFVTPYFDPEAFPNNNSLGEEG